MQCQKIQENAIRLFPLNIKTTWFEIVFKEPKQGTNGAGEGSLQSCIFRLTASITGVDLGSTHNLSKLCTIF